MSSLSSSSSWAVSAARSAFAGYAELPRAKPGDAAHAAAPVAPPDHWPLRVVVAVTSEGRKAVGSTSGMLRTAQTSPFYPPWVELGPVLAKEIREGILARDLPRVGAAMEQSTFAMHARALAQSLTPYSCS